MDTYYTLNSLNLADTYGVHIERATGLFDLPKRKGKTEHSWLDEHGVEQYTTVQDIKLDARDIVLHCFIKASSIADFKTKINAFKLVLITAGTHTLTHSGLGLSWSVFAVDGFRLIPVSGWEKGQVVFRFVLPLREPDPTVPS